MSANCIIFAAFIPTKESLKVFTQYIKYIHLYFNKIDVYLGINPSKYTNDAISIIKNYRLNAEVSIVPDNLIVESDASAYQRACLLARNTKEYNQVYFIHTKGITSKHPAGELFKYIFKDHSKIDSIFKNDKIGSYSKFIGKYKTPFKDILTPYYSFENPYFNSYLYFFTFYILRGKPLKNFLDNCSMDFFEKNIISEMNSDIYLYERDFPQIIWRQGYKPAYDKQVNWNDCINANTLDKDWINYERFNSND